MPSRNDGRPVVREDGSTGVIRDSNDGPGDAK
jgi:hypothetical protein